MQESTHNSEKANEKVTSTGSSPKIGLALGSGASRGWSHIGVIKALLTEGIDPDVVCGTSVGAIIGGSYVAGNLEKLEIPNPRIPSRSIEIFTKDRIVQAIRIPSLQILIKRSDRDRYGNI